MHTITGMTGGQKYREMYSAVNGRVQKSGLPLL